MEDFLHLLNNSNAEDVIASYDVESLFTNIDVDWTINLIINKIYLAQGPPKLDISKMTLLTLLGMCMKEALFLCLHGRKFQQIDGIAMGYPLGVLFANFFMGMVEHEVFHAINKPAIYIHINNIFVKVAYEEDLIQLREKLQAVSWLNFTNESSADGKLPFLDVLVVQNHSHFSTIYTKPTNPGLCLNGESECPQ
ncbi:uncharacterized protein LOC143030487 [Oratosquilla oratoria]|uniref:uncharacterized protein LOC143030487 n=1 Tax=Oratosquilla oratoria TaxID=337810 RepID=UPI003F75D87E